MVASPREWNRGRRSRVPAVRPRERMLFANETRQRLRQCCRQIRQGHERAGNDHDQDEHDGAEAAPVEDLNERGQRFDDGEDDFRGHRGSSG